MDEQTKAQSDSAAPTRGSQKIGMSCLKVIICVILVVKAIGIANWYVNRGPLYYPRVIGRESQRSPFLIHDGRLFFLQPDLTLTVLNMESGEVICRDTALRDRLLGTLFDEEVEAGEWTVSGRLAYFNLQAQRRGNREGHVVVDLRDGSLDLTFYNNPQVWNTPVIFGGNLFVTLFRDEKLVMLDSRTWQIRELTSMRGNIALAGDRLVAFSTSNWKRSDIHMECFDASTGERLWRIEPEAEVNWKHFVFDGKELHVFATLKDQEELRKASSKGSDYTVDLIESFDMAGNLLRREKADIADFNGSWPWYRVDVFKGVRYQNSLPSEEAGRYQSLLFARFMRQIKTRDATFTGDEKTGLLTVEFRKAHQQDGGAPEDCFVLSFKDQGAVSWEGRVGSMDGMTENVTPLLDKVSLAIDETRVVVGTPNSVIECLDRETGRTTWMYRFPGVNWRQWNRDDFGRFSTLTWNIWGEDFYTGEYEKYTAALAEGGWSNTRVDGQVPSFATHRDPNPVPFPSAGVGSIFAWCIPLLCLVAAFIPFRPQTEWQLRKAMTGVALAMVACIACYFSLGRYSLVTALMPVLVALIASSRYATLSARLKRIPAVKNDGSAPEG